jgi:uncharacterized protein YgbK (DUF1537 family)
MTMAVLGCIADDLTGATDLANNLVRAGMRVVQTIGVSDPAEIIDADAVVVALKSRTVPPSEAVGQSLKACRWLRKHGAEQIYFKVCSTFDSTPQGNIGPVIEALMDELSCDFSMVAPAFPENGRTVFQGHLFVGDRLLSESGMRNHPLTPMTDSDLVRFLQRQLDSGKGRKVGLIDYLTVTKAPGAIRQRADDLQSRGISMAIADAISNEDLMRLGAALRGALLITAASGLAIALPANWGFAPTLAASKLPIARGRKVIISGSCSQTTNTQVRHFVDGGGNAYKLEPTQVAEGTETEVAKVLAWAEGSWNQDPDQPLLVYSTAAPDAVKSTQDKFGIHRAGAMLEQALSAAAEALVGRGVGQLIIAGGETAGACAHALEIRQMQIGPQIDPGVPWCYAAPVAGTSNGLHLALKSGNFGSADFFTKAFALLK